MMARSTPTLGATLHNTLTARRWRWENFVPCWNKGFMRNKVSPPYCSWASKYCYEAGVYAHNKTTVYTCTACIQRLRASPATIHNIGLQGRRPSSFRMHIHPLHDRTSSIHHRQRDSRHRIAPPPGELHYHLLLCICKQNTINMRDSEGRPRSMRS